MVDIVDVGSGNVRSVRHWLERSNVATRTVGRVNDLSADVIVLPGVGAAGSYMDRLRKASFDKAIIEHVDNGGRLIGICLGFQIMASYSEEDGGVQGLGLLEAEVVRLPGGQSHNSWEPLKIRKDSMGLQTFNATEKLSRKKVLNGRVFYNHEYALINKCVDSFTVPISESLNSFSGLLIKNNIIGMQFHPEKSQSTGLQLISMIL